MTHDIWPCNCLRCDNCGKPSCKHDAMAHCWPERATRYGTNSTEEFETLAEATKQPDGSLHVEIVIIDKREGSA